MLLEQKLHCSEMRSADIVDGFNNKESMFLGLMQFHIYHFLFFLEMGENYSQLNSLREIPYFTI